MSFRHHNDVAARFPNQRDLAMDCSDLIPPDLHELYAFREWRNPCAVLSVAYPQEWADLLEILRDFRLLRTDVGEAGIKGGGKSLVAIRMDKMFRARNWNPMSFDTKIVVNGVAIESPTHEVDCYKNAIAIELEWNNKTEFYDRDLSNFRLLKELRVLSVGVIITRLTQLQALFNRLGKGPSYGASTTHWDKLMPKVHGGGAGRCPLLLVGMGMACYDSRA